MYYLDENMVKMVQPNSAPTAQPSPANSSASAPVTSGPVTLAPVTNNNTRSSANAKKNDPKKNSNSVPVAALPNVSSGARALNSAGAMEAKTLSVGGQDGPNVSIGSDAPPAPRPILKPVSGGVLNGTAISLPSPVYPEAAKRMRTGGMVVVEVVLDETGKVVSAVATGGPAMLREAAVSAAMKARFSPTKLSGQPVKVSGVINYKFALVP
jgi:TonB family protein